MKTVKVRAIYLIPILLLAISDVTPGRANPLTISAFGSVLDLPLNGIGDSVDSLGFIAFVTSPFPNEFAYSAIMEFALGSHNVSSASLSGTIFGNNFLDTGVRIISIEVFGGDGMVTPADFQRPATSVGTVSYHPPQDGSVSFDFDVTSAVQAVIDGGYDFVGVRFRAANLQASSGIDLNQPRLPSLDVAIPDVCPTALLLIFGIVSPSAFRCLMRLNFLQPRAPVWAVGGLFAWEWVRMNGSKWPSDGNPVSVTKLMTALRKSLVRSV